MNNRINDILERSKIYQLNYICSQEKFNNIIYGKEYDSQNWLEAYEYGVLLILNEKLIITEEDILTIHKKLMYGQNIALGEYRKYNLKNMPQTINFLNINSQIINLCQYINNSSEKDFIFFASQVHKKFIKIHPFQNGNGRVARILMNIILLYGEYFPIFINGQIREEYNKTLLFDLKNNNETFLFNSFIKKEVLKNK